MRHTKRNFILHVIAIVVLFGLFWLLSALGPLRTFLPNTLQFTGWPGTERHYLILFQNNAELRATGGFITAFALLDFKNGLPSSLVFQDVYGEIDDHEYISPPYPMDILLEKDSPTYAGHSFRDANYNPDFGESVMEILRFFYLNFPENEIDGVVAINFSVLENIVELYEPISIEDFELTKLNLFETLENAVSDIDRHNVEALATRKNIIGNFAYGVLRKMIFSPWKWRQLSEVMARGLNEKQLLLHFENNRLARKVNHLGWSGDLPRPNAKQPQDVLAVNLSNFGGMKSDRYISRDVHYTVEITEELDEAGRPILYSDLAVTLRHHGDYNTPLSGEYKGYLRVFLPADAELLESSTGTSRQEFTEHYVGWGDPILMQPGEERTFTYRFRLGSEALNEQDYRLELVKQPGTLDDFYEVIVKSPLGQNLDGSLFDTRENIAFFRNPLRRDTLLTLNILKDKLPPRIFWHEIVALNQIEITFAEPMDTQLATDPLNYEITDLNIEMPEIDDRITIDFIEVQGGRIRLYTRGMDLQPEEHFQIRLRNLRDRHGNAIEPNPRTVTVVQRL